MRVRSTDRFVKSAVPKGRKSPIFMDDEVIGFECSSFAALHETGSGIADLARGPTCVSDALLSGHPR
jgi:hypothetical protein